MASIIQTLWARRLNLALVLGLSMASTLIRAEPLDQGADRPLGALASLRWQYRIILVDAQIPDAVACLRAEQPAIDERDILWFVRDQEQLQTNYPGPLDARLKQELEQRFFSRSDAVVFLIGKDGGLKASAGELDLPALFARIDAMPMRRREMESGE
ncbi:hypothetical protein CKO42_17875 [Lamprobacter modestohalophilus]|uniref:DUF4174 domain-containing protein n=1 Tax=Lamprobacter modestohalophilus TaxID=1064514 RepID=A0A9X0WB08_9GAMM|nr:DUF4174 domain-containing protein [Lamprobacter modestohalophilus]MBK1620275.1 hypothetical protein [Lamprobacter modestohalophilus]MCF7996376.1 DUF4174 domain-containing protein [Chromatiaceae bacterium]MCF8016987.1 DUF4174 domain-containing protein [Chromatiaceae bacterium]